MRKYFPILALLLLSPSVWAACSNTNLGNGIICVQQSGGTEDGSVSSITSPAFGANITSTNALIAHVGWQTAGGVTFTCSSGMTLNVGSGTWQQADTKLGVSFSETICYAVNVTGGGDRATATMTGGTVAGININLFELSGFSATPLDVTTTSTGSGTTFSVGPTSSTTVANEYATCMVNGNGVGVPINTPTNSFVIEYTNASDHASSLDKALSSTGAVTCGATLAGSVGEYVAVVATFKSSTQPVTGGGGFGGKAGIGGKAGFGYWIPKWKRAETEW